MRLSSVAVLALTSWSAHTCAFVPRAHRDASRRRTASLVPSRPSLVSDAVLASSSSSSSSLAMVGGLEGVLRKTDENRLRKSTESYVEDLRKRVERINALEPEIEDLGDEELAAKTEEFRRRLRGGEDVNGPLLEEAFAVVREAAWRVLEQRHYDVQLIGGMVLHEGRLAEMNTGEGKTLVSTLPCYLNSLLGSSYVITVNDYLARRDAEKMGQVHRFLGLTVGLVQSDSTEDERRAAYAADVTYVTNSELGFDYLRDNLALDPKGTVLPNAAAGRNDGDDDGDGDREGGSFDGFCVVDEADSVLIDEARTPLIISKQTPAPGGKYSAAQQIANALSNKVHYTVDLKNNNVVLTEKGYRDSENALGIQSLFAPGPDGVAWAPYVQNAVRAKELFTKDKEYSVLTDDAGNKVGVGIIDSFTGRVLDGRRWADGLHQSVEAKEGIAVSEQSKVIAKVTYQALFRGFDRLSGMTGTASSDAAELADVYGLSVVTVPTALPVARRDYPDVAWRTRRAADAALVKEVLNVGGGEKDGRPCLVGTTSVRQSEDVVRILAEKGVKAELLNASPANAARESEIVAQAGRAGVVTVATNMAGRGTDIVLGGCPSTMARLKVRSVLVEALSSVMSDKEKAALPPSPADDYYPAPLPEDVALALKDAAAETLRYFSSLGGEEELTALRLEETLTVATDTTESEDDLPHVVKLRDVAEAVKTDVYGPVTSAEKETVRALGGLYVMGTNRHESRRIDDQLRGRAGRQGDPGTSRFFLSFEDEMFVVFGGDGLTKILETFRVSDDMPVEAPQITEALDRVQIAVEEEYREIRGGVLNFDEVLDGQRRVVYGRRRRTLFDEPEAVLAATERSFAETVTEIVDAQAGDVDRTADKIQQFFPSVVVDRADLEAEDAAARVAARVDDAFRAKTRAMEERAAATGGAPDVMARTCKYVALVSIDNAWSDHLQNMENLKETVILRKYQDRDPVAEYKNEALLQFQGLEAKMRLNTVYSLWQSLAQSS